MSSTKSKVLDKTHVPRSCPVCKETAETFEDLISIFGERVIDGKVKINQSWCRSCRTLTKEQAAEKRKFIEENTVGWQLPAVSSEGANVDVCKVAIIPWVRMQKDLREELKALERFQNDVMLEVPTEFEPGILANDNALRDDIRREWKDGLPEGFEDLYESDTTLTKFIMYIGGWDWWLYRVIHSIPDLKLEKFDRIIFDICW